MPDRGLIGFPNEWPANLGNAGSGQMQLEGDIMRRIVLLGLAAAVIALGGIAKADVTALLKAGSWTAFGGTTDDGKPICTMSTNGKGLWFGVKYFKDDTELTVQMSHEDWKLKDGNKVKVTMKFDSESPWSANSTAFHMSDGDPALELSIDKANIGPWLKEFALSNSLVLRFPEEQTIDDWRLDLQGASKVFLKMSDCMDKMYSN